MSKGKLGRPRTKIRFSEEIVKVAKQAGLTNEQILAVKDEESLKAIIAKVQPKALQAVYPSAPGKPESVTPPDPKVMVQKSVGLNIVISPQAALTWKRGDYEQSELDHFVNRNGIRNLVRVIITRKYIPNETSKYETDFEIIYKETE